MLSKKQGPLYWSVFGKAKKVDPSLDRHTLHAQPSDEFPEGLPASHLDWNGKHLDAWISRCKAISEPGDYKAQVRQVRQPEERWLRSIDNVLAALGLGREYAEGITDKMNRRGAIGGAFATLETRSPEALEGIFIALKIECRRQWPRKADLLDAIWQAIPNVSPAVGQKAILEALGWERMPQLQSLVYENLLIVLGALRQAAPSPVDDPADVPF